MKLNGVWIPLITPFHNDRIDYQSLQKLIDLYIGKGVSGLIPLATTGESPAIEDDEYEAVIEKTLEYSRGRVPVFVGLGGNYTKKVIKQLQRVEKYKVDGILSVTPYYNRPDQNGIYQHFLQMSEATALPIIIYNIPYRTGRNIENSTIYKLAVLHNIVGLKDSCGDLKQTTELLLHRPADFSILTGEDALFFTTLALGGDGGILASAHLATESFLDVYQLIQANNHHAAFEKWRNLADLIPLLFMEPNPAPIKYCLQQQGLIQSLETRLPLTEVSEELKVKLNQIATKISF
ncbi:MAG TPA: 4-hydroxy-tetrahydrodipicolinate synthase [Firmicutes bacterium]|nr:4-hydroxy-tetrahydrodipicolinate synthase [Bacillota bacterium]